MIVEFFDREEFKKIYPDIEEINHPKLGNVMVRKIATFRNKEEYDAWLKEMKSGAAEK